LRLKKEYIKNAVLSTDGEETGFKFVKEKENINIMYYQDINMMMLEV
jgi:hypothetical protein